MSKSCHLDVFMQVLEVVLAVLHGHLVVILTLRDVSHLSLGFVLQKQDGRRHQDTQNHLETHECTLMWVAAAIFVKTAFKLHNLHRLQKQNLTFVVEK